MTAPFDLPLDPVARERAVAVVHVTGDGRVVPDPWATLGLPHGTLDEQAIQAAWRAALLAHPPESDPDGAERVRAARARLLDPGLAVERELGQLAVPDPDAWGLPDPDAREGIRPEARLLALNVLYTLVEEALWTQGLGEVFEAAIARLPADAHGDAPAPGSPPSARS